MKRMGILSLGCAAALAMACNGNARTDNRTEPAAVGTAGDAERTAVHDSDKDFVNNMLSGGMAEVELGKMASGRAVNPEVKRFAQMMVADHSKAGAELKEIAGQYGVQAAPPTIDGKHQDLMNRLSTLRGAEFDREYIQAMVDDHKNAVDSLEGRVDSIAPLKDRITNKAEADKQVVAERSENAPKASINAWAATALPTVRQHLDEARRLDDLLDHNRTSTRNETRPVQPRK